MTPETFNKAVAHAAKMITTDAETWTDPNPMQQMFGGWNGEVMCPINRVAIAATYGSEAAIRIERAANQQNANEADRRANTKYAAHYAEAKANAEKPSADLKTGDFILCDDVGLKFDHENLKLHIQNFVEGAKMDAGEMENSMADFPEYKHVNERLVCITRIEDRPDGFFDDPEHCLNGWKAQKKADGEGYEGGSRTDDYDDDLNIYELSREDQQKVFDTCYTLAVLVRDPSGRCVLIDAEGYQYPRYVLLRQGWRQAWPNVVEDCEREIEDAAKRKVEAEEAARRAREEEHAALVEHYAYLPVHGAVRTGDVSKNLRAALKHEFPGVKFSVHSKTFSGGNDCRVEYWDGPEYEEVKKVVNLFEGPLSHEYGDFSYTFVYRHETKKTAAA